LRSLRDEKRQSELHEAIQRERLQRMLDDWYAQSDAVTEEEESRE